MLIKMHGVGAIGSISLVIDVPALGLERSSVSPPPRQSLSS